MTWAAPLAVQHAPETPDQKHTVGLWLPATGVACSDQREQLLASLEPLAEPFGLGLPFRCRWDEWLMKTGV